MPASAVNAASELIAETRKVANRKMSRADRYAFFHRIVQLSAEEMARNQPTRKSVHPADRLRKINFDIDATETQALRSVFR